MNAFFKRLNTHQLAHLICENGQIRHRARLNENEREASQS